MHKLNWNNYLLYMGNGWHFGQLLSNKTFKKMKLLASPYPLSTVK